MKTSTKGGTAAAYNVSPSTKKVLEAIYGPLDTWGGAYESVRRIDYAVTSVKLAAWFGGFIVGLSGTIVIGVLRWIAP